MHRLIFVLWLGVLSFPGWATWDLVNALAANVDGKPFSVQDAYIYRALERSLSQKKPVVLIEKGETLKKTVKKAVLNRLLALEAKEVGFKSDKKKLEASDRSLAEITRFFGRAKSELKTQISEMQLSDEFFQMKVASLTPLITDLDLQEYLRLNKSPVDKAGLSDSSQLRKILQKEKREKAVQDYVDFLTTKYGVVFFDL